MWILNKKTGVKWEIVDEKHIERLKKNKDYEIVKEKKEEAKTEPKKEVKKTAKKK